MAKKEGRISLSRMLREADEKKHQRRNDVLLLVAVIAAFLLILVSVWDYSLLNPAPSGYEFKTGWDHPQAISDLMKNGTVVVFFTENESMCPPCANMTPKIADLQSQYPKVTFATFSYQDNKTSLALFKHYGIDAMPTIFVIRSDGAVATFIGQRDDITPIKSAIEDAQNWQQKDR